MPEYVVNRSSSALNDRTQAGQWLQVLVLGLAYKAECG